jgi:transposase
MYSKDFVERAVAYKEEGHTFKQLREAFEIPPETYYQWKERLQDGYYDKPKIKKERSRKINREKLKKAVEKNPDAYLYELAEPFGCTPQAVFYMLEKLNITIKKRPLGTVNDVKRSGGSMRPG